MKTKTKTKSPLKYPGGQGYLTDWLSSLFPERNSYLTYLEPFVGGANMLLAHDGEGKSEVVNDRNGELTNFWRVLQVPSLFDQFCRRCEATPFSQIEWTTAGGVEYRPIPGFPGYRAGSDGSIWSCWERKGRGWRYGTVAVVGENWKELAHYVDSRGYLRYALMRSGERRTVGGHTLVLEAFVGPRPDGLEACHNDGVPGNNRLENLRWDTHSNNELDKAIHKSEPWRAWKFFVRCRQSMLGLNRNYAPLTTGRVRRGMNEQASAWWSAVDGLADVHARLGRVVILNEDGVGLIAKYDKEGVFVMADPPFDSDTRTEGLYACEFGEADHRRLVDTLLGLHHAKVLLCGYRTPLYEPLEAAGWTVTQKAVASHMTKDGKGGKPTRSYAVWRNYGVTP